MRSIIARLAPAFGAPGPHHFAVRVAPLVGQRRHVHRIPAPRVVTTAIRPSMTEAGCASFTPNQNFGKQEYFCAPGLTRISRRQPSGKSGRGADWRGHGEPARADVGLVR